MAFFGITNLGYQDSIKSRCSTQRPVTCPASPGIAYLVVEVLKVLKLFMLQLQWYNDN